MTRSRRSAELEPEPPEFLLDRNLGKTVPVRLTELGWKVHRIAEFFPNDAQEVEDEEWISLGLDYGWVPLCKDGRIKTRTHERQPLEERNGVLFYLDNQQLRLDEMVRRIHGAQAEIYRAVHRGGPATYAIGDCAIRRTWPP